MTAFTALALITAGYRDAQKLARGASLNAEQQAEGLERLVDLINLWQTQGLKLFLESETTLNLVAGQQLYSCMLGGSLNIVHPLQVKEASYWDADGNNRPLIPISRQEWTRLSGRTQSGVVTQLFAEKLYDRLNVYLWSVPDALAATGTVKLVLRNQATNPANINASVLFPPEWGIALRWGIADEVSSGMPEAVQQRCQTRASAYRQALEDWDVEDAETYFQPDTRWNTGSRFR